MSSDCFDVRVTSIQGAEVIVDVLTSTAGGHFDMCTSRSFALLILHDALRRAVDHVRATPGKRRNREIERLYAKHETSALHQALPTDGDWYVSEAWMRENVGRFIESTTLVERRNLTDEDTMRAREEAIVTANGGALYTNKRHVWGPQRWAQCHNYTLHIVATEERWVNHLEEGLLFGTTAYDVWWEG